MNRKAQTVEEIVAQFAHARVAVVGDFISDVYLSASPKALSREAPVIVARWESETQIPGGAANAVHNLVALGAKVYPFGLIGQDPAGAMLKGFFDAHCASQEGVCELEDTPTVSKMRIMVGEGGRSKQQVLRIDKDPQQRPSLAARQSIFSLLKKRLPDLDGVLFSDYGYGLVDGAWAESLRAMNSEIVLTADSRSRLADFSGLDLVTPNHKEVEAILNKRVLTDDEAQVAATELLPLIGTKNVIITRGNRGMLLDGECGTHHFSASGNAAEVTDVTGAGDTVISLATLSLISQASPVEAARLANHGAGVVVTKPGAATITPTELIHRAKQSPH